MGFSRKRNGRDGKPRYTAYYLDFRGQERSAGTYASKKTADKAWQDEEAKARGQARRRGSGQADIRGLRAGRVAAASPAGAWRPLELRRAHPQHLLPFFGPMKMRDILPEHVRQWVTWMKGKGASAQTIKFSKGSVLNAILTTALTDGVVAIHASHGVKIPPTPARPRRIITSAQFNLLYEALPDADAQLLVETDIESGMRGLS
jgi:hypothetical protein